jgi:hypothetical protein
MGREPHPFLHFSHNSLNLSCSLTGCLFKIAQVGMISDLIQS